MDIQFLNSVEELASQTKIEEYGDITMVTIPGCSKLSQSERAAIFARAQQQRQGFDADALSERLRCVTPPLDEEEELEFSKSLERDARETLQRGGCPPCYPPDLEIPILNPPEQYKAIVQYWQSFPQTEDVILRAQLTAWNAFRSSQQMIRRRYGQRHFSKFVQIVRDRLQKHGLHEDLDLCLDWTQQTSLQTWIEYLEYNLNRMDKFEARRDRVQKELSGPIDPKNVEAASKELGIAERDIKRHKVLLAWIEEQRRAMTEKADTVEPGNNTSQSATLQTTQKTSSRKRHLTTGQVDVDNSMPKDDVSALRSGLYKEQDRPEEQPCKYLRTRSGRIPKSPLGGHQDDSQGLK